MICGGSDCWNLKKRIETRYEVLSFATSYRPNNTMFTRHPKKKRLKENQPHISREFLERLKGSGTNLSDRKAYLTDVFLKLMNILEKVVT